MYESLLGFPVPRERKADGWKAVLSLLLPFVFCFLSNYYVPGTMLSAGSKSMTQTDRELSHKRALLSHLIFRRAVLGPN